MIIKNIKIQCLQRRFIRVCIISALTSVVIGCGATNPPTPSEGHIKSKTIDKSSIPKPVSQVPTLPRPGKREKLETYTVVVNQVPVRELLFSMARDADMNLDIDNKISGKITMNAINQTLPKILERIAAQTDIVYYLKGDTIKVMADKPYLHVYHVDYLNINRSSSGTVSISTEIGATAPDVGSSGSASSGTDNKAKSEVESESINEFWSSITKNIAAILGEEVKKGTASSVKTSNDIIVNRESGIIAVRATSKQHKTVKSFIDEVVGSVERQVLIEATIAEVRLSDKYQAGIDWSLVSEATTGANGQSIITKGGSQNLIGGNLGAAPFFQLASVSNINGNPLNITLKALETFGDVKVLSSPKVMALNNQTAILKVVDNEVYFTTEVTVTAGANNTAPIVTVDTDINSVPVGFVMAVTPYIDDDKVVTLNVRPTISRIIRFIDDPNPSLADAGVTSQIPVIQLREIETMLKIKNQDTAVIGGLMQDQINKENSGVPGLSSLPVVGKLFTYNEEEYIKSELVIFIRPVVIEEASLDGDLSDYKKYLLEDLGKGRSERLDEK